MKNETYQEEPGLGGNFPGREKHGRDACVARVAMGETHASREWPWMATPGLRGAGTAQRNVSAASMDGGKFPSNPGAGA